MMIELYKAFLEAKKEFADLEKSGTGAHNYKYSTIEDINNATFSSLAKNNLIIIGNVKDDFLYVRLYHTLSGQWLEDVRKLVNEKPGNQSFGASQTYQFRYALKALLNIGGNEGDDDCQAEQDYIEQQNKIKKNQEDNSVVIAKMKKHILDNNLVETIKNKFNINFSSEEKLKIEPDKLVEIINFLSKKSLKETVHV